MLETTGGAALANDHKPKSSTDSSFMRTNKKKAAEPNKQNCIFLTNSQKNCDNLANTARYCFLFTVKRGPRKLYLIASHPLVEFHAGWHRGKVLSQGLCLSR